MAHKTYPTTQCKTCGKTFQKTGQRSAYCSTECKPSLYTHTCETCGKTWGTRKAKTARYCSRACIPSEHWAALGRENGPKRRRNVGGQGFRPETPEIIKNPAYGVPRSWSVDRDYIFYNWPSHPGSNSQSRIYEHRAVAWEVWGDAIFGHHVDHINGIKTDNRIENLQVLTHADHARKTAKHDGAGSFWNWVKANHSWIIDEWKKEAPPADAEGASLQAQALSDLN